jgi:3-hydroxyisobutyrate dehydrogenase
MLNHLPIPGVVEKSAANHAFKPGFSTDMMLKDMRLAQRAALDAGVPSPLGGEAAAMYGVSSQAGRGALDYSVVIKLIAGD